MVSLISKFDSKALAKREILGLMVRNLTLHLISSVKLACPRW